MFGISGGELVLLLLIGLVVLGPERLPRVANKIGSWLGQARRMTRVMKRQLEDELDLNNTLQLNPPKREPSTQPVYKPPRDDDDYSPAHEPEEIGTGVDDEPVVEAADVPDENQDPTTTEESQADEADGGQAGEPPAEVVVDASADETAPDSGESKK